MKGKSEEQIKAMSDRELLDFMGMEMNRRNITHLGISSFKLDGKSNGGISVHGTDEEIFYAMVNGLMQIGKAAPDIFLAIVLACKEVTGKVADEGCRLAQDAPVIVPTVH